MSLKFLYEYDKKKVKMKFKKSYAQFNVKLVLFHTFHSKQFIAQAAYQHYLKI